MTRGAPFGLLALLILLVACDQTADASAAASAGSSVDTPAPSAPASTGVSVQPAPSASTVAEITVDSLVAVVVPELHLRAGPTTGAPSRGRLPQGSIAVIAAAPAQADGFTWFPVAAPGLPYGTGCVPHSDPGLLTCPVWDFGWVAAADEAGEPWIEPAEPSCPPKSPTRVEEIASMQWGIVFVCYQGQPMTLEAYVTDEPPGRDCLVRYRMDPSWLSPCDIQFLFGTEAFGGPDIAVRIHPSLGDCEFGGSRPETCPMVPYAGQWVQVDGMFDHPDAASCQVAEAQPGTPAPDPTEAAHGCRYPNFVVTAIRPMPDR